MVVVKRILRYLKEKEDYGLWYTLEGKFELKVYTDADWAGNIDDRKSTTSGALFLGERLVTWISKKQACISQSTIEAKYVTISVNCSNIAWIRQLLEGMNEVITDLVIIYCDNTSAINISKNPMMDSKTNHISIKYHYLREQVQEKQVQL